MTSSPNIFLTLTCCSPFDFPARSANIVIGYKVDLDNIGFAFDGGARGSSDVEERQGVLLLSSNRILVPERWAAAAAPPHQDCPVTVIDCQVVP